MIEHQGLERWAKEKILTKLMFTHYSVPSRPHAKFFTQDFTEASKLPSEMDTVTIPILHRRCLRPRKGKSAAQGNTAPK